MNHRDSLIQAGTPVSVALRKAATSVAHHLFVVDERDVPQGVVAEGALRDWIATGGDPSEVVDRLMGVAPEPLTRADSLDTARERVVAGQVSGVPVVDEYGAVVDVVWTDDVMLRSDQATASTPSTGLAGVTVVVMAGGLGSRLAPFSTILPKPLMPVGDSTAIERVMETFARAGCDRFIVSLGHRAELIRAYFRDVEPPYVVEFVNEERPLGTAGALGLMRGLIDSPFFVTNCDVLIRTDPAQILEAHRSAERAATIVAALEVHEVPYGVLKLASDGGLVEVSEKPQVESLVSTGVYVLDTKVLDLLDAGVHEDMTELLLRARELGPVGVYPIGGDQWLDIGRLDSLQTIASSVFEGWI